MEEILPQIKDSREWQKLWFNVFHTSEQLKNKIKSLLEPYAITYQQFNILQILKKEHPDGLSTKDISERMINRMTDSSRMVNRLKEKELVKKCTHPEDARQICVTISESGLKKLDELDAALPGIDDMFCGLDVEEAEVLNELLSKACKDEDYFS